ncbi:MAG: rRNA maturation RNase YbeY [Hyphomicrobiaceae bacterium]
MSEQQKSPLPNPAQHQLCVDPGEPDLSAPDEPGSRLLLDVMLAAGAWEGAGVSKNRSFDQIASAIAAWPELIDGEVEATVMLSNDAEVAELNAQFRGKAKPTNVLSFPADNECAHAGIANHEGGRRQLGDIILAWETVSQEASEAGISVPHHVQHLVLHGVLHLLGYDHQTDDEAGEMESLETAILNTIGISDPYADNFASSARQSK